MCCCRGLRFSLACFFHCCPGACGSQQHSRGGSHPLLLPVRRTSLPVALAQAALFFGMPSALLCCAPEVGASHRIDWAVLLPHPPRQAVRVPRPAWAAGRVDGFAPCRVGVASSMPPHVALCGTLLSRHWHSQPHRCPLALLWCGLGVLVSWMTCITCMAGEGVVSRIRRLHSHVLVSLAPARCHLVAGRGVCLHVSCWLSLTRLSYGSMCAVTQPLKVLLCTGRCAVSTQPPCTGCAGLACWRRSMT